MVRVKFFASYREQIGKDELLLELGGKITLKELLERLKEKAPQLDKILDEGGAIIAVNHEVADRDALVSPEDEVAVFPPVSGGQDSELVRVQREDFSVGEEVDKMRRYSTKTGGIVVFIGTAREFSRGKKVKKLIYEHYPGMAEKKLMELRKKALETFDIIEMSIVHRTGEIGINENIVLIITTAVHREDAFKACRWCIDELKRAVPIWKKEVCEDGEVWVEEHP